MNAYVHSLMVVVVGAVASAPSGAQPPVPLSPARVTLVASETPSQSRRTEVVRRAHRLPQNVVVVDRNASADDLAAALAMVNALRLQFGDSLTHDFRARPEHVRHGARWQESAYRKWLHEQLLRLRKAPAAAIESFGVVQSVQITLPPPTGSVTGPKGGD